MAEQLFDDAPFIASNSGAIHDALLINTDATDRSCLFYGRVVTARSGIQFVPVEEKSQDTFSAGSYRSEEHRGRFKHWLKLESDKPADYFEGFIVGLPVLTREGVDQTTMHVWADYSSIYDETFAIPLGDIVALYLYPELVCDMQIDLGEIERGARSRYRVPVLFDAATKRTIYRDAEMDDILSLLDGPMAVPTLVYEDLARSGAPTASPRTFKTKL